MKSLKICLIGCGIIAQEHAKAYSSLGGEVEIFTFDVDGEKARKICDEFGFVGIFNSLEEILRSSQITAVDICLPHDLHFPVAKVCAEAGKHILIEKPITKTLEEADELISVAQQMGVLLMVAENLRFHPSILEAKRLIEEGRIGRLNLIQANSWQFYIPSGWRRSKEQTGGGVLIDAGIHSLDIALNIAGPVETVYALRPSQTVMEMNGEDGALVLMRHKSGVISEINVTWGTPGMPQAPKFVACGTEGAIYEWDGLWLDRIGEDRRKIPTEPPTKSGFLKIEHFVRCVKEGKEPSVSGKVGREDLALVTAAYKSMETGKPVKISEL
jgi:predicted dehydrogenase